MVKSKKSGVWTIAVEHVMNAPGLSLFFTTLLLLSMQTYKYGVGLGTTLPRIK